MHVLQQAEDMVKLRIQKDEDNAGKMNTESCFNNKDAVLRGEVGLKYRFLSNDLEFPNGHISRLYQNIAVYLPSINTRHYIPCVIRKLICDV